jgi:ATP-dependent DNA helicase DinG
VVEELGNALELNPPEWLTARTDRLDWGKLLERTDELTVNLKRLADPEAPGARSYVRTAKLKGKAVTLEAVRIDVAPVLRKLLWNNFRAVVATSATLTAKDGFASFRRRVGANAHGHDSAADNDGAIRLLEVPSPFDYRRNGLLFLPPDAADHNPREAYGNREATEALCDWWADWMFQLVDASDGGAFLLFPSRANMKAVYQRLESDLKDFPLLIQEEESHPGRLLTEFKKSERSVLFGVRSCWQGLDVPGPALRLVVINRLPMPALDILFKARQQVVKARGGNDFTELSLYEATTLTKQGFGRLHRRTTDQGVVALLDSRHQTMPYGREMLDLLPPARRTASLEEVQRYFAGMREELMR